MKPDRNGTNTFSRLAALAAAFETEYSFANYSGHTDTTAFLEDDRKHRRTSSETIPLPSMGGSEQLLLAPEGSIRSSIRTGALTDIQAAFIPERNQRVIRRYEDSGTRFRRGVEFVDVPPTYSIS